MNESRGVPDARYQSTTGISATRAIVSALGRFHTSSRNALRRA